MKKEKNVLLESIALFKELKNLSNPGQKDYFSGNNRIKDSLSKIRTGDTDFNSGPICAKITK